MKSTNLLVLLAVRHASAAQFQGKSKAPIDKVVEMLEEIRDESKKDGEKEQASYDKFACWCEDTVSQKATDINQAKDDIEECQSKIIRLKGDLGEHGADISYLKKQIKKNVESQKEATEVREKENGEYQEEKEMREGSIGALEGAIKTMSNLGPGNNKKAFLDAYSDAQLLSVVSGVKQVLNNPEMAHVLSEANMKVMSQFVKHPENFVKGADASGMSALQITANPFGDYAPASGQVQGILNSMYDDMMVSLEKANAEEGEKQKAYEGLMETKKSELEQLEADLERNELDNAEKTAEVADCKEIIDKSKETLKADEEMFADAKKNCKDKAFIWNERSRLRSQELGGIEKAIEILTDPDAAEKLKDAQETFLQVGSVRNGAARRASALAGREAYTKLKQLATSFKSLELAKLAVKARTGGHFDKVIVEIDKLIAELRKEEKEDREQRDRCEADNQKNANEIADLEHKIGNIDKLLDRHDNDIGKLQTKITNLEDSISQTESDIEELKDMRKDEEDEFKQALKDDEDAIPIIQEAIDALKQFYNENKIPLELVQKDDPRPNTNFGDKYEGSAGASRGAVGMMEMIKTDLEKEMKVAKEEDAEAEKAYLKDRNNAQATLEKMKASKDQAERDDAHHDDEVAGLEEEKTDLNDDLDAQNDIKVALEKDCGWIETHWDSRWEKRKTEIQGLVDAKNYLAGVESGDADDLDLD